MKNEIPIGMTKVKKSKKESEGMRKNIESDIAQSDRKTQLRDISSYIFKFNVTDNLDIMVFLNYTK